MFKLENIVQRTVNSRVGRLMLALGITATMYGCSTQATPTPTHSTKEGQTPARTERQEPAPVYTPTPKTTPIPTPTPTPSTTPTPEPVQVIIPKEVPAPISIDLSTIQYEPIISYETKLGNTDISLKDIFERVDYEITGRTMDGILTKNGLEDRIRIFILSKEEYNEKFPRGAGRMVPRSITDSNNRVVKGADVYVMNYASFHKIIFTLSHESAHAFSIIYEAEDNDKITDKVEQKPLLEAVADLRQVAFIRHLEENYGLTAYNVTNNTQNREYIEKLVEEFGQTPAELGLTSFAIPYRKGYTGIWDEVLNNPEWHDEAIKGRLSPETLWDVSTYLLKKHLWDPAEKLSFEQQDIVSKILIERLDTANSYRGRPTEKVLFFP